MSPRGQSLGTAAGRRDASRTTASNAAAGGVRSKSWNDTTAVRPRAAARAQTAGRGRRGRDWISADGDLAASLLLTLDLAPAAAATLGFVAGLALDDALRSAAPGLAFELKWPNDVISSRGKLAGILLDSVCQWLILGASYPGAALVVGPVLIGVPYAVARALACRAAAALERRPSP